MEKEWTIYEQDYEKTLAVVAAVMITICYMPFLQGSAGIASAASEGWNEIGTCEWQVTDSESGSTLTVRPVNDGETGTLPDGYNKYNSWPWRSYKGEVDKVVIDEGVKAGNSTAYMFYQFEKLTDIEGLSYLDTSGVTDMGNMFNFCIKLKSIDLSGFDTSKVTNMSGLFKDCDDVTSLDLSGFDTSKVTDMSYLFSYCCSLTSLNISGIDTKGVTNMSYMFEECHGLSDIDLSDFNTSKVTDMSGMFYVCTGLEGLDVSKLDTSKVTAMKNMFAFCSGLKFIDLSTFNTGEVTDMNAMFGFCTSLKIADLSGFYTSKVKDMSSMFSGCRSLKMVNLAKLDISELESMYLMFTGCASLKSIYVPKGFKGIPGEVNSNSMFYGCSSLVGGKGTVFDENHVDGTYARIDGGPESASPGYFTEEDDVAYAFNIDLRRGNGFVPRFTRVSVENTVELVLEKDVPYNKEFAGWSESIDNKNGGDLISTENLERGKQYYAVWKNADTDKIVVTEPMNLNQALEATDKTDKYGYSYAAEAVEGSTLYLNLDGFTMEVYDVSENGDAAVLINRNTEISLKGKNIIDVNATGSRACGIYAYGGTADDKVTVKKDENSSGTLKVFADASGSEMTGLSGISVDGSALEISDATVYAEAGKLSSLDNTVNNCGILIKGKAENALKIDGGKVKAKAGDSTGSSFGICVQDDESVQAPLSYGKTDISDGAEVIACAGKAANDQGVSAAIMTCGSVEVSESLVRADNLHDKGIVSSCGDIRLRRSAVRAVYAKGEMFTADKGKGYGVDAVSGDIYISGKNTDIDVKGGLIGISARENGENGGSLYIRGGDVTVDAAKEGLWAGKKIDIEGGKVSATAHGATNSSAKAIYSQGTIELEKADVTAKCIDTSLETDQKRYGIRAMDDITLTDPEKLLVKGVTAAFNIKGEVVEDLVSDTSLIGYTDVQETEGRTVLRPEAGTGIIDLKDDTYKCVRTEDAEPGPAPATKYTVTFDNQGHGEAVPSQSVEKGGKVTEPADPVCEGYVFGGWYRESACSIAWDFDSDVVTEDTVLYAKWEEAPAEMCTVTFDNQGHGEAVPGQSVEKGCKVTEPADPVCEGYVFGGWYRESACSIAWDFDSDVVTEDTVLYAKWEKSAPVEDDEGSLIASGKVKGSSNIIWWTPVKGAKGYDVYYAKCGTYSYRHMASTKAGKCTVKKSKLNRKECYKYYVKAYKLSGGKKTYIAKAPTIHIAGAKNYYSNAVKVKANIGNLKMKVGKTAVMKGKIVRTDKNSPVLWKNHTIKKIRYKSSRPKVASVSSDGVITAKRSGKTFVYAYAANGIYKRVLVTVK